MLNEHNEILPVFADIVCLFYVEKVDISAFFGNCFRFWGAIESYTVLNLASEVDNFGLIWSSVVFVYMLYFGNRKNANLDCKEGVMFYDLN